MVNKPSMIIRTLPMKGLQDLAKLGDTDILNKPAAIGTAPRHSAKGRRRMTGGWPTVC